MGLVTVLVTARFAASRLGGGLTEADIAAYRPLRRDALCRPYQVYVVCVPPPPSSGLSLLQFLGMAEQTPDLTKGADSPEAWVAFGRLQRLMYADRDRYVGDADFVGVPIAGLLDPDYVAGRAALAAGLLALPAAPAGAELEPAPAAAERLSYPHDRDQLDSLGAYNTRIVVSGDLDEYAIAALRAEPVGRPARG